ncbi:MAG: valine--tRNA ligase [Candidatus Doudnabacteria bacterium CG10_big_fil_rev_8_21_14_0_10_41_10]|uniref:Valine--tRNA ligase n=1 Tax=Candidatus Doudnabacteria bacterium CG10_big_fil_rev_8_21_14_0_10_41_10 TaxID=1974551 RepID=A0A2H0VDZ2_9BACT|nr:MAG: valine--tRNA ligase [Candidatus Doudnabacteria bacterium CG10_big_fil_rev_8_21_14_0_10_41_10]
MTELPKTYDASKVESKIYKRWLDSGYFNPDKLPKDHKDHYTISMPPPNVTGTLHIGHALGATIQDVLIRFARMQGKKTLWLPGTDHAAIATQSKVEKEIYKKEKKTRHDYGREEFLKLVEKFAQESHDTIIEQLKRMGTSCDWSREAYTLDEQRTLAVRTAFKNMYEDGLIYRGSRIVNWDPRLATTVSDDEVEWEERKTPFYYIKYGPFTIGTARPETKFGDKYVVMHPDDKRYKKYKHGDQLPVEWINGKITATVIKDKTVDMEFGTGVMTITPWHDKTDFDIAERHNLDKKQIIDYKGKLLSIAQEFAGIHIKKAHPMIVEKLKEKGLLKKIDENYVNRVAINSRGGELIEPQIKKQWFVNVNAKFKAKNDKLKGIIKGQEITLKDLMKNVVASGQIKITPDRFTKIYYHWIDNLRDWCISRQIWYGHRMPVWYKGKQTYVGIEPPEGDEWKQDPDTLDTWFSSGLWTFSTLGWPNNTSDLKTYHPTNVMETGYDILFFWIARMILMSGYNLSDIPFKDVYMHGLVRDKDRQKMSKSKGNIIDPLGVIDLYGTDALRMALVFSTAAGNDIPLAEEKIKGMKHFANKLWNIARFVLTNTPSVILDATPDDSESNFDSRLRGNNKLTAADKDILQKLKLTIKKVTENFEKFRLHEAAQEIYQFTWHELADKYLEASKEQLKDEKLREPTQTILLHCLIVILKLLHPFMPFVTEEIWSHLNQKDLLIISKWPTP